MVEYLSVSEVAHLLRLSPLTVYRSIQRTGTPAVEAPAHGGGMEAA